jgi:hypothetical protein
LLCPDEGGRAAAMPVSVARDTRGGGLVVCPDIREQREPNTYTHTTHTAAGAKGSERRGVCLCLLDRSHAKRRHQRHRPRGVSGRRGRGRGREDRLHRFRPLVPGRGHGYETLPDSLRVRPSRHQNIQKHAHTYQRWFQLSPASSCCPSDNGLVVAATTTCQAPCLCRGRGRRVWRQ